MRETSVPTGWSVKSLGDLGQVKVGLTYKPENVSEFGTLVLRSSNIQNDRLAFHDNVFVDIPVGEGATVHSGDLLICVRNGSRRLIGKTAMIDQNAHGMAFGAFMSAFRSDLNPYLIWLFQSQIIQAQIEENLGATINQITNATLKRFKIPLPDDPKEQEAIAEALSDADALIEGLERLIAKKRLIKQGAMQDLLTAKRRLPGFSGEWETKRLSEIGQVKTGLTYSPKNVSSYGTLVLRSSNIQDDRLAFLDNVYVDIDVSDEATVRTGDLLICVRNGSRQLIGKTAMIDERANGMAFGAFMSAYRSDLNDYLIWCFQSSVIQKQVAEHLGATINQITNKTLKGIEVPIPIQEEERSAIAGVLTGIDAEIQTLDTRLEKARQVKEGMMQNLLTGRIRLI